MKFVCFYELLSSQSRYTYQVHMELQRISLYILEIIIKININKNKIMQKKRKSCIYIHTRSTITVQDLYFSFTGLRYLGLVFVFYLIIYLKALLQCCYFIKVLLMTIEN